MLTAKTYMAGVVNRGVFQANLIVLEKARADEIGRLATCALGDSRWYRVEIEPHRDGGFVVRGVPSISRYDRAEDVLAELEMAAALTGLKADDWRCDGRAK